MTSITVRIMVGLRIDCITCTDTPCTDYIPTDLSYPFTSVCYVDREIFGTYYFSTIGDFCDHLAANDETNYNLVSDSVGCGP